jgi:hypothetical protein
MELTIPKSCTLHAMRTFSKSQKMDISEDNDFVLVKDFEGADIYFLEKPELKDVLSAWENYVKDRLGNLIILRRFVFPAPGTFHLAYYSQKPIAGPGISWVVSNLKDDDAKILCLWFDCSIHLFQILLNRIEDVWMDIHKYALNEMLIIDPSKLTENDKTFLLEIFEEISQIDFPSIYEQFNENFKPRETIDKAILNVLGFTDTEIEELLPELYEVLKYELNKFYEQMGTRGTS